MPKTVEVNKKISLPIFIDTAGITINAAEVYLKFDPKALKVESVSKEKSFFRIWITGEPKFNNEKGEISFAGGVPAPGFSGNGQIGTVEIIPLKNGIQILSFDQKSRILLNDGVGTETPLKLNPIKIKVK